MRRELWTIEGDGSPFITEPESKLLNETAIHQTEKERNK